MGNGKLNFGNGMVNGPDRGSGVEPSHSKEGP